MGNYMVLEHSDSSKKAGILDKDDMSLEYYSYEEILPIVSKLGIKIEGISTVPHFSCRNVPYELKKFNLESAVKQGLTIIRVQKVVVLAEEYKVIKLFSGHYIPTSLKGAEKIPMTSEQRKGLDVKTLKGIKFKDISAENIRQMRGSICLSPDCIFQHENGYDSSFTSISLINGKLLFDNSHDKHRITAESNFSFTANYTPFIDAFQWYAQNGVLFPSQLR